MAQVSGGQVILNNGQKVTPQMGGWYDGQQFWGGTLSNPGQFNSQNNQAGQQGAAPVQNQQDANYLIGRGDTTAGQRIVGQPISQSANGANNNPMSMPGSPSAPAPFDLVGATNAAYNSPEIIAANGEADAASKELITRQTDLATAQAGINDNPFFSEATRVGKSQQLTQQADAQMGIIQNKQTLAANKVASLKADAAIKINAAQGQYNINRQAYQDTLEQFNMILQSGGFTNATPQDLATYSAATGMSMSVLQSIQETQKQKNIQTQVIPSTDSSGRVTLTTIDTQTGKIINQTSAGQVSTGQKETVKAPNVAQAKQSTIAAVYSDLQKVADPKTGFVSKEDWAKVKTAAISTGDVSALSPSEFNSNFASFTNPDNGKGTYNYN